MNLQNAMLCVNNKLLNIQPATFRLMNRLNILIIKTIKESI